MTMVKTSVSIFALAIGLAAPALAQAPGQSGPIAAAPSQAIPSADGDRAALAEPARTDSEIVVTGSRIQRSDYTAESPIVTIGQTTIQNNGTPALDQALNVLPQFTGSASGQSPTATTGQARSAGRATANLRGLGPARTLVLLDGRRLQPSDPFNVIDLNTIPSALIQNVEVITGGASAVYGSDAVAGVVNFKLNPRFSGIRLDADNMISSKGDGRTTTLSGVVGTNFRENRGNAVLAVQYFNRDEVFRSQRRFFDAINGASQGAAGLIQASGTNLVSNAALTALFRTKYGLATQPSNSAPISVNPDGTLYGNIGAINFKPQDQYFINPANNTVQFKRDLTLLAPLERISLLGRTNYKLNDAIEAYAQILFTDYRTEQNTAGVNSSDAITVVPVTNPFVPADLRLLLASRPDPTAPFQYFSNTSRVSPLSFRQHNTTYQALGGLRGTLGLGDFKWDAYLANGRTRSIQSSIGYASRTAFANLAFAPDGGNSICAGGYPLFTTAALSPACRTYLSRPTRGSETFDQTEVEVSVDGGLVTLPAGAVRLAAGGDYRRNKYTSLPDRQFTSNELLGGVVTLPAKGSQAVAEAFAELYIPLIHDTPLIDSFSVDLAYRYSHYDTSGGVSTYKASGEWRVIPGIMLRGGYQRAIRAPSVGELFSSLRAGSSSIGTPAQGGGDPCDIRSVYRTGPNGARARALCIAQGVPTGLIDTLQTNGTTTASRQIGNPDLAPEIADSFTGGVVLRPKSSIAALSNLSFSVDYYKIKIRSAIGTVPGSVSLQTCFNGTGENPSYDINNVFCKNITRASGGTIDYLVEAVANLARYETSGIDAELDWTLRAGDFGMNSSLGAISLNVVGSYVDHYRVQTVKSAAILDYVGTIGNNTIDVESLSHPKWRVTASMTYSVGVFDIGIRYRYLDGMTNSVNVGSTLTAPGVKSVDYVDLNARMKINDRFELRGGVVNLGDRQPPVFTGQSATDAATYDLVGRRFFIGATARF